MTNENLIMNILIFSKDRALQLDALLHSLYLNMQVPSKVKVLWTTTSSESWKSYKLLMQEHPVVEFIHETSFRNQTIGALKDDQFYTMFLVDDDMMLDKVNVTDPQFSYLAHYDMLAISCRLHDGATHGYATDTPHRIPPLTKGAIWNWKMAEGDWGYPMSLDGNIYKTSFIKQILNVVNFSNPNNLEAALDALKAQLPPYMCCYGTAPRLVNFPFNLVQSVFPNRYNVEAGHTVEKLNSLYLDGFRIDVDKYQNKKYKTVHVNEVLHLKETTCR